MRVGILIVAYNAVTTLTKVLDRIPPHVWDEVEEVVVFDDASQDSTYELGIGYRALTGNTKLHILKNARNLGYGGNQKAGYQYFMQKGVDVVVLLHGDGQYAPEILADLYRPIVNGEADAVFGSRMKGASPIKGGMPLYKYVGNRILTIFENALLGMHLSEFHSGYRAYSLQALRQIDFTHMTDDFHFDTEIIIKLNHQGFRIREVPIPTYYGGEICYVNGMAYAGHVVRAVFRYKRVLASLKRHPEFAEYFVDYPLKTSKYSSHYYLARLLGHRREVLDLGCGDGRVAEAVGGSDNVVVGIDVMDGPKRPDAFAQYVRADLTKGLRDALDRLDGRTFDDVVLLDVLEHLPAPEILLRDVHLVLRPAGRTIVSVPNVANITVRIALAFGRFDYAERGILDKTHVRFFTRRTARRMLEEAGFEVLLQRATIIPWAAALGVPSTSAVARAIDRVLAALTWLLPGLLGYQFVFVLRESPAHQASADARPARALRTGRVANI